MPRIALVTPGSSLSLPLCFQYYVHCRPHLFHFSSHLLHLDLATVCFLNWMYWVGEQHPSKGSRAAKGFHPRKAHVMVPPSLPYRHASWKCHLKGWVGAGKWWAGSRKLQEPHTDCSHSGCP